MVKMVTLYSLTDKSLIFGKTLSSVLQMVPLSHRPTTGQILGEMVPHNFRRFPAKLEVPINIYQYKLDYFLWVPNNIQYVFGYKTILVDLNSLKNFKMFSCNDCEVSFSLPKELLNHTRYFHR